MKRDMDLIRKILLTIEEHDDSIQMNAFSHLQCNVYTLYYHIKLLHEAGFIEGEDASSSKWYGFVIHSITWEGHEFLDAAREDTRWQQAKEIAGKAGMGTLEAMKSILIQLGAETLKRTMLGS